MKFWILAGLFTVLAVPMANASERPLKAEDAFEMRRAEERMEAPVSPTPQRVTGVGQRTESAGGSSAGTTTATRPTEPRRRGGSRKRVPDAVLMAPRGAL